MTFPQISFYPKIGYKNSQKTIALDEFLEAVQSGEYQDIVIPIRTSQDKEQRKLLKEQLPSVTLSGTFTARFDKNLLLHSGYIGVDIDDLGPSAEALKDVLATDPYVVAAFTSVSGMGLCVIFQIEPDHHRDAYQALADYFLRTYKVIIDPTGINVSRPRFISWDPNILLNQKWTTFKKYLPKEPKRKLPPVVFVQSEFDEVVRQVIERKVDCCEMYRDWIGICFGLCNRFGEAGRSYFHALSAISGKYDPQICDHQYDVALKHDEEWTGEKTATLATFYWHAKNAGINISSDQTRKVAAATTALKKNGKLTKEGVISSLEKFSGISPEDSAHIVEQVYDSGIDHHNDDESLVDTVLIWLKAGYDIKFNQVTRRMECDGVQFDDMMENSIFLDALRTFEKLNFDLFRRILISNNMTAYNPLHEWFYANQGAPYNDEIIRFWRCIPVGSQGEFDRMVNFGTKWLISVVASIFGDPSPLVLVLAGEKHGTGKTEVFRRLLPRDWRGKVDYYAESKLDGNEADVAQLMCQKVIIMDDEFGGQSKKEARKFKALTSRATFSVRKSYGRNAEDLQRLAVLCGTCQELEILNDATGDQRRLIPVHVIDKINYEEMNGIDRTALWAELYRQYQAGQSYKILGDDIQALKVGSEKFTDYSLEYELIKRFYEMPGNSGPHQHVMELTNGDIKTHIEACTGQRINEKKLGQELKRIGFKQMLKRIDGSPSRVYQVVERWLPGRNSVTLP